MKQLNCTFTATERCLIELAKKIFFVCCVHHMHMLRCQLSFTATVNLLTPKKREVEYFTLILKRFIFIYVHCFFIFS